MLKTAQHGWGQMSTETFRAQKPELCWFKDPNAWQHRQKLRVCKTLQHPTPCLETGRLGWRGWGGGSGHGVFLRRFLGNSGYIQDQEH
jgi:hypothetical protein